jgi:hypothetical protein
MAIPNNFPSVHQIPDNAILDVNYKQVYLGNHYSAPVAGVSLANTNETNVMLLKNPSTSSETVFVNYRSVSSNDVQALFKYYHNPTVTYVNVQTVAPVADVAGSLNNTYFLLDSAQGTNYYVWMNINSAGVDPAVADRTGIEIAAATGATAGTIGAAIASAVDAVASGARFDAAGTTTVTISDKTIGPVTAMSDGAAPTGFTFAVVSAALTPVNLRIASANAAAAECYRLPVTSASGTLIDCIGSPSNLYAIADNTTLIALDPGQSMLITATKGTGATTICNSISLFYEL